MTRKLPDELTPELVGPDHCLQCWAMDGNLCGRCLTEMIAILDRPTPDAATGGENGGPDA